MGIATTTPTLSESLIIKTVADLATKRLVGRVTRDLQKMGRKFMLSPRDLGLKNVWDEICVQKQYEIGYDWDEYDTTIFSLIAQALSEVAKHEQEAIWLQTEEGQDWSCCEPEDREPDPVIESEIIAYLLEKIYDAAGDWENDRIRAAYERSLNGNLF